MLDQRLLAMDGWMGSRRQAATRCRRLLGSSSVPQRPLLAAATGSSAVLGSARGSTTNQEQPSFGSAG